MDITHLLLLNVQAGYPEKRVLCVPFYRDTMRRIEKMAEDVVKFRESQSNVEHMVFSGWGGMSYRIPDIEKILRTGTHEEYQLSWRLHNCPWDVAQFVRGDMIRKLVYAESAREFGTRCDTQCVLYLRPVLAGTKIAWRAPVDPKEPEHRPFLETDACLVTKIRELLEEAE